MVGVCVAYSQMFVNALLPCYHSKSNRTRKIQKVFVSFFIAMSFVMQNFSENHLLYFDEFSKCLSLSLSASFCVRAVSPITFNLNFSADYTLVLLTYCELFWLCVFLENQNICKKLTCKNSAWMPCHLLTKIRIHEQRNEMIFDLFPMRCSIFVLIQDESVDATRVMGSHIRL